MANDVKIRSLIVNGCTSLNLVLGLSTVLLSCGGYLQWAACCLLGSVVWDAADGFLARRWKVASEFGAQLDSLADMTSFAVGGAAFVCGWFRHDVPLWLVLPVCFWLALTGAWRLARFNVGPKRPGEFYGMPTTAVATMVSVTYLTCPSLASWLGLPLAALLASLMVSPLPYPKFTKLTDLPWWFLLLAPVAGYYHLRAAIWLSAVLYLCSGPFIWWRRRSESDLALAA